MDLNKNCPKTSSTLDLRGLAEAMPLETPPGNRWQVVPKAAEKKRWRSRQANSSPAKAPHSQTHTPHTTRTNTQQTKNTKRPAHTNTDTKHAHHTHNTGDKAPYPSRRQQRKEKALQKQQKLNSQSAAESGKETKYRESSAATTNNTSRSKSLALAERQVEGSTSNRESHALARGRDEASTSKQTRRDRVPAIGKDKAPKQQQGRPATAAHHSGQSSAPAKGKRGRPDDTLSPREDAKRTKTGHTPRNTVVSYATAAQSHLKVALTTVPQQDILPEQVDSLVSSLNKTIFKLMLAKKRAGQPTVVPDFNGRPFLCEGVIKFWGANPETVDWLKESVQLLPPLREGVTFTVIPESEMVKRVKAGLFLPDEELALDEIQDVLEMQNPRYNIGTWRLYGTQKQEAGLFMSLGIPVAEIPALMQHGRRISYGTGSIYVRFFTSRGQLSDEPETNAASTEPDPTTSASQAAVAVQETLTDATPYGGLDQPGPSFAADGRDGHQSDVGSVNSDILGSDSD